jgi:hypothetical protein
MASRLTQRSLRVVFFWIPTLTSSCIGVGIAVLFAYVLVRFRNS